MKIKNLNLNKRKISSIILAFNLMLCSKAGNADIKSYETETTLVDGTEIMLHYLTGDDDNSLAVITLDNQLAYAAPSCVNYNDLNSNNMYQTASGLMEVQSNCYMYSMPEENSSYVVQKINPGTIVEVVAKSINGWYTISVNGSVVGFIHEKNLLPKTEKVFMARITNDYVNIRDAANMNSNVLGKAYKDEYYEILDEYDEWYRISYNGSYAYVSKKYSQKELHEKDKAGKILMAKLTGNNVNVRSGPGTSFEKIGFADTTDYFEIIGEENGWYKVKYLNQEGYIYKDYVREELVEKKNTVYKKVVFLTKSSAFYKDINSDIYTYLPEYQSALVIGEKSNYYLVNIDGIIGYINKSDTKSLSSNCIVIDLSRQILKLYCDGREVYRAKIISGREQYHTNIGCFEIGHKLTNYTFGNSGIFNEYWLQFDGNIGLHPADANNGMGWQEKEYFEKVVDTAYKNWAKGNGQIFPNSHGSHGCINMQLIDIEVIYQLVNIHDNVLVIGPNNLKQLNLSEVINYIMNANLDTNIENNAKIKKLV